MLQVIFGDDEHTAKDGPYARLMKTRKWVYLTSAFAVVLSLRLYREDAVLGLIHVVELPWWLLSKAVLAGLVYLGAQYGLLIRQLWSCYDIVLVERLAFRRAEDLAAAEARLEVKRQAVISQFESVRAGLQEQVEQSVKDRLQLRGAKDKLVLDGKRSASSMFNPAEEEAARQRDERLKEVNQALSNLDRDLNRLEKRRRELAPPDVDADPDVVEAQEDLFDLRAMNPADRSWYRASEIAIDVIRIALPAVSGVASATNLAVAIFQGQ